MRANDDLPLFLEELVLLLNKYHFSATLKLQEITSNNYRVSKFFSFEEDKTIFLPAYEKIED